MKTPCNHYFHKDCLVSWADVKLECPTCRAPLPPLWNIFRQWMILDCKWLNWLIVISNIKRSMPFLKVPLLRSNWINLNYLMIEIVFSMIIQNSSGNMTRKEFQEDQHDSRNHLRCLHLQNCIWENAVEHIFHTKKLNFPRSYHNNRFHLFSSRLLSIYSVFQYIGVNETAYSEFVTIR